MAERITTEALVAVIKALPQTGTRHLVAVAGAPASGKSTLAEALAEAVGPRAAVVPMDGFHLDNTALDAMDLRHRKGAPETFDAAGFLDLMTALKRGGSVPYPTFDRSQDATVPNGATIPDTADIAIVEGNYLMLTHPVWRDLAVHWDISVGLDVPIETLEARLTLRWLDHGFLPDAAKEKALGNDIPNAHIVVSDSADPDYILGVI